MLSSYGPPQKVWTSVTLSVGKEAGAQGNGVTAHIVSNWVGKTTTRLAEASWVSFEPEGEI